MSGNVPEIEPATSFIIYALTWSQHDFSRFEQEITRRSYSLVTVFSGTLR